MDPVFTLSGTRQRDDEVFPDYNIIIPIYKCLTTLAYRKQKKQKKSSSRPPKADRNPFPQFQHNETVVFVSTL